MSFLYQQSLSILIIAKPTSRISIPLQNALAISLAPEKMQFEGEEVQLTVTAFVICIFKVLYSIWKPFKT